MKICVVGAGWYGVHLALKLEKLGYEITLVEKKGRPFDGISGNFGIRLHKGPHYPRSQKTRENCRNGFARFYEEYPELIEEHEYSIYAFGKIDSNGKPSKVSLETFKSVCAESDVIDKTNYPQEWGYNNIQYAAKIHEPSICLGSKLRDYFVGRLSYSNISIYYEMVVEKVSNTDENNQVEVFNDLGESLGIFDYVINATSYQSQALLPDVENLPFEVRYQVCGAFFYRDKNPTSNNPFSFIVMDGMYPCVMPYIDESNSSEQKYVLTHGKWTILASFETAEEAHALLRKLDVNKVEYLHGMALSSISSFWPDFSERFEYLFFKFAVLAKLVTDVEFRSAVTFLEFDRCLIHAFPGKVSNVFDVENEIISIIKKEGVIEETAGFGYVEGGVLHEGMKEIVGRAEDDLERNTCHLQTYFDLADAVCDNNLELKDDLLDTSKPDYGNFPFFQNTNKVNEDLNGSGSNEFKSFLTNGLSKDD